MGSGFLVNLITGRLLGPTPYGSFGIVYALISTSYIVLGGGVKRAITKYVAAAPAQAGDIRAAGMKVQMALCAIIVSILFLLAEPLSLWLNDGSLKLFIRYAATIVPVAGILYVYVGYFDGRKQFERTAVVTVCHSLAKVVFVFLLLYIGYEVPGAIAGLLMGLGSALLCAALLGRKAPVTQPFALKNIIHFSIPVLSFFICISFLTYIDLFFVKAMLGDPAKTGYYTAAQTISRLISFAMFPFGAVLLPFISSAIARNDDKMVRRHIGQSMRYVLIILVPACIILSLTARQVLILVYGPQYAPGALSLSILFLGTSCWGLTHAMVSIIHGYGQPGKPALIFAVMIPLDILLINILIPQLGLEGAAVATTCTFITGMILAAATIYRRYGVLAQLKALFNILIAALAAASPLIVIIPTGGYLLLFYLLVCCIYLGVLWLLGELKREDVDFFMDAIKMRKSQHEAAVSAR